jgi:hypothetical protein
MSSGPEVSRLGQGGLVPGGEQGPGPGPFSIWKSQKNRTLGEDEEMERGDERGVAKRPDPDPNELDVPQWAENWHWEK